jgi:alanyl-tRNA synthetase
MRLLANKGELVKRVASQLHSPVGELERKISSIMTHQKELEKAVKAASQREAANVARNLIGSANTMEGIPAVVRNLGAGMAISLNRSPLL